MNDTDISGISPDIRQHNNLPNEPGSTDGAGERESFDLSSLLESVPYPASKDDILDYATDQDVAEEILGLLEGLPDITYNTPNDVSQALGDGQD